MNISIYIPDHLKSKLEVYSQNNGITKNAAIRRAIEMLIKHDNQSKWGDWINQITPNQIDPFESYRSELKDPKTNIL